MQNVILTIHMILAVTLIIVVLLQRSEGGGLGIGGGSGIMTGRGAATALSKLTWGLGIAFVVTSLSLTIVAARQNGTGSVLDRLGIEQSEPQAPATPAPNPGLSGDLLPPSPTEGPAAPPPAQ